MLTPMSETRSTEADGLLRELQQVAAQRNLASFSELDLPLLHTLSARIGANPNADAHSSASIGKNADVQTLIDVSIPTMPTPANATAAAALVGSSTHRWTNLKERRHLAGKALDVTGETFRKNHETGVLTELAATLVHGAARPADPKRRFIPVFLIGSLLAGVVVVGLLVRGAPDSAETTTSESSSSTSVAPESTVETTTATRAPSTTATTEAPSGVEYVPSGQLDVTLHCTDLFGASAVADVTGGEPDDWACRANDTLEPVDLDAACASAYGPATRAVNDGSGPYGWTCVAPGVSSPEGECPIAPGDFDPEFSYDLGRFSQTFTSIGLNEPQLDGLCPAAVVHRAGEGVRQEYFDPSDQEQAVVAAVLARSQDEADFVTLSGSAWSSFNQVAGLGAGLVGYPLSGAELEDDGSWRVPFSVGGGLVANEQDGPFRWMPAVAYERWKEIGGRNSCLKEPVSNPYPINAGFRQDFAEGHLILDFASGDLSAIGDGCP